MKNRESKPELLTGKDLGGPSTKNQRKWVPGIIASVIALAWAVGGIVMPSLAANSNDEVIPGSTKTSPVFKNSWEQISKEFVSGLKRWDWSSEGEASKILDPSNIGLSTNPATPIEVNGSATVHSEQNIAKVGNTVLKSFPCMVNVMSLGGHQMNTTCWVPARYTGSSTATRSTAVEATPVVDKKNKPAGKSRAARAVSNVLQKSTVLKDNDEISVVNNENPSVNNELTNNELTKGEEGITEQTTSTQNPDSSVSTQGNELASQKPQIEGEQAEQNKGETLEEAVLEISPEEEAQEVRAEQHSIGDTTTQLPVSELVPSQWTAFTFQEMAQKTPFGTTLAGGGPKPNYYYYHSDQKGVYKAVSTQINGIPYYVKKNKTYVLNAQELDRPFVSRLVKALINGKEYYSLCGDPGHFIASHGGGGVTPETNLWGEETQAKFQILIWMFHKHPDWFGSTTLERHRILQYFIWWIVVPGSVTHEHFGPDPALVESIRKKLQEEFNKNLQTISEMMRNLKLRGEAVVPQDGGILYHVTLDGFDKFRGDLGQISLNLRSSRPQLKYTLLDENKRELPQDTKLTAAMAGKGFYVKISPEQLAAAGGCTKGNSLITVSFEGNALVPGVTWKHGTNQAQVIINPVPIYTSGQVDLVCVGQVQKPKLIGTVAAATQDSKTGLKNVAAGKDFTISDDVQYAGLDPQSKYVIEGSLRGNLQDNHGMRTLTEPKRKTVGAGTQWPIDPSGTGTFKNLFSVELSHNYAKQGNVFVFHEELFAQDGSTSLWQHKNDADRNQTINVVKGDRIARLRKTLRNSQVRPDPGTKVTFQVDKMSGNKKETIGTWDIAADGSTDESLLPSFPVEAGVKYVISEKFEVTASNYYIENAYWNIFNSSNNALHNWVKKDPQIIESDGKRFQTTQITWIPDSTDLHTDVVIEANNCYQKKVGTVRIYKRISDQDAINADPNREYTFKLWRKQYTNSQPQVYVAEGVNKDGTFNLKANGNPRVFSNLPFGYYFVTEETPGELEGFQYDGLSWDVTVHNGNYLVPNPHTLAPISVEGKTSSSSAYIDQCNCSYDLTFTATNKYTPSTASFTVEKQAFMKENPSDKGIPFTELPDLADKTFNFTYQCGAEKGNLAVKSSSSVSVEGVRAGTKCTLTETGASSAVPNTEFAQKLEVKIGGKTQSSTNGKITFTVPKNKADVKVLATNIYTKQKGYFKISKSVTGSGANLAKGKPYNFQYVCGAKTYPLRVPADGTTTVSSQELPVGTSCEIFEMPSTVENVVTKTARVTIDGKTKEVTINGRTSLGKVTIKEKATPVTISVENTVEPKTAALELVKRIDGPGAGAMEDKNFGFSLSCTQDGKSLAELNGKKINLKVPAGKTDSAVAKVADIPVGASCTLEETSTASDPAYVNTSTKWDLNSDSVVDTENTKKATFTIKEGTKKLTVTAVNTYVKNTTFIKVQKVFNPPAGLTNEEARALQFTFDVKCIKNSHEDEYKGINLGPNQTSEELEVRPGARCVVKENSPAHIAGSSPARVEMSTNGQADNVQIDNGKREIAFTVPDKYTDTAVVTAIAANTYTANDGSFQLLKRNGDQTPDALNAASFDFTYVCETGGKKTPEKTVSVQAGGSPINENPGRVEPETVCYVWESATPAMTNVKHEVEWSGNGVETVNYNGKTAAKFHPIVSGSSVGTITATNRYTLDKGRFTLAKKIVKNGDYVSIQTDRPYVFDMRCTYQGKNVFTRDNLALKNGQTPFVSPDLPVGTTCTVEEQDATPQTGHTMVTSWEHKVKGDNKINKSSDRAVNITIGKKNQEVALTAINTFTRDFGKFAVRKAIKSNEEIDQSWIDSQFSFSYTCTDESGKNPINGKISGVEGDRAGNGKFYDSKPIPAGYTCNVTEDPVSQNQYVVPTVSISTTDGEVINDGKTARFKVRSGGTDTRVLLTAVNTYVKAKGSFEIKKLATGLPNNAKGYAFDFNYSCSYGGATVANGNFTLTTDESSVFKKADLPVGSQCTVKETGVTPAINGVVNNAIWEVTQRLPKDSPKMSGSGQVDFTIAANNSVAEVKYQNNYTTKMLPLKVLKKNAEGTNSQINSAISSVKVSFACKDGNSGTNVPVPVGGHEPITLVSDVAYGTECEIWEEPLSESSLQVNDDKYSTLVDITVGGKTSKVKPGERVKFKAVAEETVTVSMQNAFTPNPAITTVLAGKNVNTDSSGRGKLLPGTGDITFTDTVQYRNLEKGQYVLIGQLHAAGTTNPVGSPVVSKILNLEGSGQTSMDFVVTRSQILAHPDGLVAFEKLYKADDINSDKQVKPGRDYVAHHEDPNDRAQTNVITPVGEIRTVAQAKGDTTGVREFPAGQDLVVVDTVKYRNLPASTQYRLIGLLVKHENGENQTIVARAEQNVSTKDKVNSDYSSEASWEMTFEKVAKENLIGGQKFTVLEYLVPADSALNKNSEINELEAENATVAKHAALSDPNQTLVIPALQTNAEFKDGSKTLDPEATGQVIIRDRVSYQQLVPGKKYTITGRLAIKGTDPVEYLTDASGKEYTQSLSFTASEQDATGGEKVLEFSVDAKRLQGKTVVAFEKMSRDGIDVAVHEDINDPKQTVSSVKLKTTATNAADGTQVLMADQKTNVADLIEYQGLTPGVEYIFVGQLKDKEKIGKTDNDSISTAWISHKPTSSNGSVQLTFKDVVPPKGSKLVVFERAYMAADFDKTTGKAKEKAKPVGKHEDPNDTAQTVTVPKVTTNAKANGSKLVDPAKDFQITDVVTYTNLDPTKTYTVDGKLMVKDGTEKGTDTGITQSVQIGNGTEHEISPSGTGTVELTFTVTAQLAEQLGLIGKPIVAFETVSHEGKTVAIHHDINDDAQTVYAVKLSTKATAENGKKNIEAGKAVTIKDTVTLQGRLEATHKYAIVGQLVDKTDSSVVSNAHLRFDTDAEGLPTNELVLNFPVKAADVQKDHDLVVFETLYNAQDVDNNGQPRSGAKVIAEHKDLNDQEQTVKVPSLETTATDSPKGDKNGAKNLTPKDEIVTVYDRVDYTGLIPGKEYELKGQLYYQADATLADGTVVKQGDPVPNTEVTKKFTPTKADGFEVLTLTAQAGAVLGQAIVTFEDLFQNGTPIGSHHDINDEKQTVYVPKVKTVATNALNGSKIIQTGKPAQIVDQMTWSALSPGEYVAVGTVHNPNNSAQISEVKTQVKNFTVQNGKSSGTVKLSFDVPANLLEKSTAFVVFEKVYRKGDVNEKTGQAVNNAKPVASHEDPTDAEQTVTVAKITTEATDAADADKYLDASQQTVRINDEVFYEGLNPQYTYTITGQLHLRTNDGKDGGVVGPVQEIKIGPGEATKVDSTGKGSIVLTFEVDSTLVAGKQVVAFEELRDEQGGLLVHHDINDDAQTVYAIKLGTKARVKDESRLIFGQAGEVIDTVTYEGLLPGAKYRVEGVLTKNGTPTSYTAQSKEFEAKKANGSLELVFKVDKNHGFTKNDKIVVFEKLIGLTGKVPSKNGELLKDAPIVKLPENSVVARHEDPNDPDQSVVTGDKPGIKTVLWTDTVRKLGDPTLPIIMSDTASVNDTVLYENLEVNVNYKAVAQLVVIGADGKVIETKNMGSKEFLPTESNGSINVPIALSDRKHLLPGVKVVAFETLYRLDRKPGKDEPKLPDGSTAPGEKVTEHKDSQDNNQTVITEYKPEITTLLADASGKKIVLADNDVTLTDTVTYRGLAPGKKYVLVAKLVHKKDATDTGIRALKEFVPQNPDGSVKVDFNLPAATLKQWLDNGGEPEIVAFQQLWEASRVTINQAGTSIVPNGETPDAAHQDSNDPAQTVRLVRGPAISTHLAGSSLDKADTIFAANNVTVTDHVSYVNLLPETNYKVTGELMVPGATAQDSLGTNIKGETTFKTAKAKAGQSRVSGTVNVEFKIPLEAFSKYTKLVAFEKLYLESDPANAVASHEDPNDPLQTIALKKPRIGTEASAKDGGTSINIQTGAHVSEEKKKPQVISDTVTYNGLQPRQKYLLTGQLHVQKTNPDGSIIDGGALKDTEGKIITTADVFTAKAGSQSVKVNFNVPYELLKNGDKFVVFERLYAPGSFDEVKKQPKNNAEPVARHEVIDSAAQTVVVNNPSFGDFKFTKRVSGQWNDHAITPQDRANIDYKFKYTCVDNEGQTLAAHSTDWIDLKEGESKTVQTIPEGATCTIEENVSLAEQATASKVNVEWKQGDKTLTSDSNGKLSFKIGGEDGNGGRQFSYDLDVNNILTPNPAMATNTTGADGKIISAQNGGVITDNVSYWNLPAGTYHLHTYLVQKQVDASGTVSFKRIDWVPTILTDVESKINGAWSVRLNVPEELAQSGDLIVWEDLYRYGEFDIDAQGPKPGAKIYLSHHEEYTPGESGSQQAVKFTSNLSRFKIAKKVDKDSGLNPDLANALPVEYNFEFKCVLPEGKAGKFDSLELEGKLKIRPGEESKTFNGYPVGTVCTITEEDPVAILPTGVVMNTDWSIAVTNGENVTNEASKGLRFTLTLGAGSDVTVTANNRFKPIKPEIATEAKHANGSKLLDDGANDVVDTVMYKNLSPSRSYMLVGELFYDDGTPVMDGATAVKSAPTQVKTSETGEGTWKDVITLKVPADADKTKNIVFYETLFELGDEHVTGPMVVDHRDPQDPNQTVKRRAPQPEITTLASVVIDGKEINTKTFTAGTAVTVRDEITYQGLIPGTQYKLVGRLMKNETTPVGNTVTKTVTAQDKGSGTWSMDLVINAEDTKSFTQKAKLVVFETLYAVDADPTQNEVIVAHEDMTSEAQTVHLAPATTPPPPTIPTLPSTTTPGTPPPGSTPPPPPSIPTLPQTTLPPKQPKLPPVLARTGAQAAIVGLLSAMMIASGAAIGLYAARRRRKSDKA